MPKLKNIVFYYYSKTAKDLLNFTLEVRISQDGIFYASPEAIPKTIKRALPDRCESDFRNESLKGLVRDVEELINDHRKLLEDEGKQKIILYRILLQGDLTPELGGNEEGSRRHYDLREQCDVGVGLVWRVAFKTKILGQITYQHLNGLSLSLYKEKEMPWTQQRQEWFENLEISLKAMIGRIDDYLGDEKELPALIDSGLIALPAPQGKK